MAVGLFSDVKFIKIILEIVEFIDNGVVFLRFKVFFWCYWGLEKFWVREKVKEDFFFLGI